MRGPEIAALAEYADELVKRSQTLGGIVDADTSLKLNKPGLRVEIDRARAADLGVDSTDIATALRLMVGGEDRASRFRDESINEDYDVQLRLAEQDRSDVATIERLYVPSSRGGLVRLDNLVNIKRDSNPSRIDRLNRERLVSMRASVAPGFALADRIEALRGEVTKMNLPAAYTTTVSGRARELERTFTEFIWAFILSVLFMYMILASQFESTVHPGHDPAEFAAVNSFCLAFVVGHWRHAQSLFGPGHTRALWRCEEKLDPADRSHEQPARARHGTLRSDHAGQSRPSATDPDDHPGADRRHVAPRFGHGSGR